MEDAALRLWYDAIEVALLSSKRCDFLCPGYLSSAKASRVRWTVSLRHFTFEMAPCYTPVLLEDEYILTVKSLLLSYISSHK